MSEIIKTISDFLTSHFSTGVIFWFTVAALVITVVLFLIGLKCTQSGKPWGVVICWIFALVFLAATLLLGYIYLSVGLVGLFNYIGKVGTIITLIVLGVFALALLGFGIFAATKGAGKFLWKVLIVLSIVCFILFGLTLYFGFFYVA